MNNLTLNGQRFSDIANHKFTETIQNTNGKTVKIKYDLNLSLLKENDLVYCKTDDVLELFFLLKKVKTNINLITSQSDYEIDKSLFLKKPKNISKWFAINVNYNHPDLIPIPLGIGYDFSKSYLLFDQINNDKIKKNKKLLYINHRIETFPFERKSIYDNFFNNEWCTIDKPTLDLKSYKENLEKHCFMICPRGNGIDTHRLWECTYANVIPIVKKHITYKNVLDAPILYVDSYDQITKDFLESKIGQFNNLNKEKLNIVWWKNFINKKIGIDT